METLPPAARRGPCAGRNPDEYVPAGARRASSGSRIHSAGGGRSRGCHISVRLRAAGGPFRTGPNTFADSVGLPNPEADAPGGRRAPPVRAPERGGACRGRGSLPAATPDIRRRGRAGEERMSALTSRAHWGIIGTL